MPTNSLLFVPDITGFTEFVNNTEIEHSQHIISELLEKIIDSNELAMEVSEVEGDAVLFYKEVDVPSFEKIYEQAKKMFMAFHSHLRLYESQRICQCGACASATKLSLKFIVHSAEIGFTTIKNKKKPFGAEVVLLHRLFKNNVEFGEYILYTDKFINDQIANGLKVSGWNFSDGFCDYKSIGLVSYKYISLSDWHQFISDPPAAEKGKKSSNPIVSEHTFEIPIMDAYAYLSDFELKKIWNDEIDEFRYEEGKVNRVGTKHICVFDKGTAEFETVTSDFGEGKIVYGEKLLTFPLAKDFTFYFILTPDRDKTKIRMEIHYQVLPVFGWIFKPIIKMNIKKIYQKFITSFSKLGPIDKSTKSVQVAS